MDADLASEAAKLYALPASEFTAARTARAKQLRAKQPDLGAAVAVLPKPTAAAAAVNRLAREEPSEVRALVQAGKRLRAAQEDAVSGTPGEDLPAAIAEHREALDRVRREARRLELSATVLDRVTATLRAASVDPEAQSLLERGLLARELDTSGFGLEGIVAAPPSKPKPKPKPKPKAKPKPKPDAAAPGRRERLKRARTQLADARTQLADARTQLADAKRVRTAAGRAHRDAVRALEQAVRAVARAETAVGEAETAVERAEDS